MRKKRYSPEDYSTAIKALHRGEVEEVKDIFANITDCIFYISCSIKVRGEWIKDLYYRKDCLELILA